MGSSHKLCVDCYATRRLSHTLATHVLRGIPTYRQFTDLLISQFSKYYRS